MRKHNTIVSLKLIITKKNINDLEENDAEKEMYWIDHKNIYSNEDVQALKQNLRKKLYMEE